MKTILKNIPIYCDKVIVGLLLATVITVPLFFDIRLYSVFDLSKVMALYLLTIAILVVWSIALVFKHGFKFSHTAIDIPTLAYIFIFIISSIISINPIMSLFGTYKRFEGLTATLCYILLFILRSILLLPKKTLFTGNCNRSRALLFLQFMGLHSTLDSIYLSGVALRPGVYFPRLEILYSFRPILL